MKSTGPSMWGARSFTFIDNRSLWFYNLIMATELEQKITDRLKTLKKNLQRYKAAIKEVEEEEVELRKSKVKYAAEINYCVGAIDEMEKINGKEEKTENKPS